MKRTCVFKIDIYTNIFISLSFICTYTCIHPSIYTQTRAREQNAYFDLSLEKTFRTRWMLDLNGKLYDYVDYDVYRKTVWYLVDIATKNGDGVTKTLRETQKKREEKMKTLTSFEDLVKKEEIVRKMRRREDNRHISALWTYHEKVEEEEKKKRGESNDGEGVMEQIDPEIQLQNSNSFWWETDRERRLLKLCEQQRAEGRKRKVEEKKRREREEMEEKMNKRGNLRM